MWIKTLIADVLLNLFLKHKSEANKQNAAVATQLSAVPVAVAGGAIQLTNFSSDVEAVIFAIGALLSLAAYIYNR